MEPCKSEKLKMEGRWKVGFKEEVKKQLWLAGPLFITGLLQYSLQVISVMFVGHLGELALAGASMATSFASVTGFNLLMGMASGLDTLCGQSFGAKQYEMLGIHMQRAILVLSIMSSFLAIIWTNTKSILIVLHQDADISKEAGIYAYFMIPGLFAYGILQCLVKFLQTQNNVYPMMLSSGITTLLHLLVCWVLAFKSGLGSRGAALANSISYWVNVVLLVVYVKFSSSCNATWTGFSMRAFQSVLAFLKLAIPSALMLCLKVWTFEVIVLLSGFLPNPKLETSVLSICLNTFGLVWMVPFGLGASVSTRVSNELGAGRPEAVRLASSVAISMAAAEGILVGGMTISFANVWGHLYSNENEVIEHVSAMMPFQSVLSGVVRRRSRQKIGAYINFASFYLVGIPCAVVLAFIIHMKAKGLWLGTISAFAVQGLLLLIITIRTDWVKQANDATKRILEHSGLAEDEVPRV